MIRFLFAGLAALLVGTASAAERKLRVLTTFLPAYSFAVNVAGEHATVENLLPGGVSLHDFQLTPAELRKIAAADLLFVNGLGMETFLDRAIASAGPGAKEKVAVLSAGLSEKLIPEEHDHHHSEEGHHHDYDPHIWLDPWLAMHCVTNVLKAFQQADPGRANAYAANAQRYLEKLAKLDREIASLIEPVKNVPLITYHNAFRYFARRYGLQIAGVVELVPEVSPSPREMRTLHQTIRARGAKALFTEPGGRTRLATQIAKDTGIKLAELDPLETGDLAADSYELGLRRNAETLRKTLAD